MQKSENSCEYSCRRPARKRWLLIGAAAFPVLIAVQGAAAQQGDPPAAEAPEATPEENRIAVPSPPPPEVALPTVEPIIGDEEFEKAIPPISAEDDPELDRPLESIAEFERRQAAEAVRVAAEGEDAGETAEGASPPAVDGVPVPALADGDSAEAIGEAPIGDSELAAPLPPLDNFDVEPVEFAQEAEAADNRELAYQVQVNGLDAADDSTGVDLADLFGDLSALYDGDGKADNAAMVRARLSADAELMQRISQDPPLLPLYRPYESWAMNKNVNWAPKPGHIPYVLDFRAGSISFASN